VPVIRAVASFHGVTGRDAGPTGSRLGMVGHWIQRVMKVATENVSPYLGNPALRSYQDRVNFRAGRLAGGERILPGSGSGRCVGPFHLLRPAAGVESRTGRPLE